MSSTTASTQSPEETKPSISIDKSRKLYPERGGDPFKASWFSILFRGEGREGIDKIRCERNVYKAVTQASGLGTAGDKLLLNSNYTSIGHWMNPVDIRRHISCEACDISVTGGYDPFLNQVVVCQNTARSPNMVQGVLSHEFIHMFDFCRHEMDLNDLKHLACTEVRAANLVHCSYLGAFMEGTASMFKIKEYHQNCVKYRALKSVMAVRDISEKEAWNSVAAVFDKCYNDLEPFGRRIRRGSSHMERAYQDRINMGYE